MKTKYRCLYNHEMLINFTTQTPYQSYDEPVKKEQFVGYVEELRDTQVDVIMCCPLAWRLPTYHSRVNDVWQTWGKDLRSPLPEADWKYFDKVFARVRRYMLSDDYEDPQQLTIDAARRIGKDVMFSYRMNDNHYTHFNGERDVPTMDPLWRNHPEWRIPNMGGVRTNMNYAVPEVREWYYAILEELIQNYDVAGLELDFMRHENYFLPGEVESGAALMTDFVKRVRDMVEREGRARGKELQLGVRVPLTLSHCRPAGLDVERWQRESLIDFINISPSNRITAETNVRSFRQAMPEATLYGELHFYWGLAKGPLGLGGTRHSTKQIYETAAHSILEQGADGISIFNFCYVRDHSFHDPRLRFFIKPEPPFEVLHTICDREYLAGQPRHYSMCGGYEQLPRTFPALEPVEFELYVAEDPKQLFKQAILRLQFSDVGLFPKAFDVSVNGQTVPMVPGSGELFPPASNEGLPAPLELFFFEVPLPTLVHGVNRISVFVNSQAEFFFMQLKKVQLQCIELALYR